MPLDALGVHWGGAGGGSVALKAAHTEQGRFHVTGSWPRLCRHQAPVRSSTCREHHGPGQCHTSSRALCRQANAVPGRLPDSPGSWSCCLPTPSPSHPGRSDVCDRNQRDQRSVPTSQAETGQQPSPQGVRTRTVPPVPARTSSDDCPQTLPQSGSSHLCKQQLRNEGEVRVGARVP